jgi:hypothetical protein
MNKMYVESSIVEQMACAKQRNATNCKNKSFNYHRRDIFIGRVLMLAWINVSIIES